ncbi:hypothetical protein BpHYR1_011135 [Brachionus plicatilis]|uniref:Uncharacterized protein n=1 Tax=Brachionus plicatilis TaxID=10195 RepID=A0A3M7S8G3_BRAPC|nr:hypothetical protein BpHYR1_011135 [Brachionus plicatilis]
MQLIITNRKLTPKTSLNSILFSLEIDRERESILTLTILAQGSISIGAKQLRAINPEFADAPRSFEPNILFASFGAFFARISNLSNYTDLQRFLKIFPLIFKRYLIAKNNDILFANLV